MDYFKITTVAFISLIVIGILSEVLNIKNDIKSLRMQEKTIIIDGNDTIAIIRNTN